MITEQEKAKELVDKMLFCYQGHIDIYTAKQCALIAVDEILNLDYFIVERKLYWYDVKQEIQKLL